MHINIHEVRPASPTRLDPLDPTLTLDQVAKLSEVGQIKFGLADDFRRRGMNPREHLSQLEAQLRQALSYEFA